jgi:hypothetical protein
MDRRVEGVQELFSDVHAVSASRHVLNHDNELVATEPCDGVVGNATTQAVSDCGQQLITNIVAVGVVDRLERVDVEQQHGHAPTGASDASQGVLQPVLQQRPVREISQRVVERLVP